MAAMTPSVQPETCWKPSAHAASTRPARISMWPGSAGITTPTRPITTMATASTHSRTVTASAYDVPARSPEANRTPFVRVQKPMRYLTLAVAAVAVAMTMFVTAPRPQAQSFNAVAGTVDAPDPNVPLFFEAASIKPSDPKSGPGGGIRRQPGGRFNTFNMPVRFL